MSHQHSTSGNQKTHMAELDTNIPSSRQVQGFIKDKKDVEVKLTTNDVILGKLRWQDPDCLCLQSQDGQDTIIWRHAIAYVRPKS